MTHVSDEFLSAHIDGEPLAPADAAHVEECATCQARRDEFRHVAAAVGAPVSSPAAHLREAAVAIAVDEARGKSGKIRSLDEHRSSVKAGARRMNALSAAAALVVALGVGGYLLSQVGGSEGRDDKSMNTNAAVADAGTFRGDLSAGGATSESDEIKAGWVDAGDIGAFSDTAPIATHYRNWLALPEEQRHSVGTIVSEDPCPRLPEEATMWQASLTYSGEPAYVRVVFVTQSTQRLEVLRRTDCGLLASQAI